MIYKAITSTLLSMSFLLASASHASDAVQANDTWSIVELQGVAQVKQIINNQPASSWQDLAISEAIKAPIYLRTLENARLVLKHRNDKVTIAANSLLKLEKEKINEGGILTKIFQQIGYAIFDIEKNSGRINTIETPYLISVVKGTTFTVDVGKQDSTVNLLNGKLEIKLPNSNQSVFITSGQQAQASTGAHSISVIKTNQQVISNKAQLKVPVSNSASSNGNTHAGKSHTVNNSQTGRGAPPSTPPTVNSAVNESAIISNAMSGKPFPGRGVPFNSEKHPVFGTTANPANRGKAPDVRGQPLVNNGSTPGNSGNAPGRNK